ncbi:MAG: hypothetical protein NTZ78_04015 [Candidatus Aureabacteria bacterium]|nr:hypothetical protein [Candidatus Auribacterota bacterium]
MLVFIHSNLSLILVLGFLRLNQDRYYLPTAIAGTVRFIAAPGI